VKVFEQLGVEAGPQIQGSHDAGHAQQFHPHRQAGDDGGEPHEGVQTRECRAQQQYCVPPGAHTDSGCPRSNMVVSMVTLGRVTQFLKKKNHRFMIR
jgi:hypothetical protein